MSKIEHALMSFGGHQYRRCYRDLCWAIYVVMLYLPDSPQMKYIVAEVCERTNKGSPKTVWRSVSRAVEDLWKNGDKDALGAVRRGWRWYQPKPQEFIYVMAWTLRVKELRGE